jgi:glycosyltransferase involved in cell wall biosynthesis
VKILIVQDYLRSGGTERQSVLLANAFSAAGHATTLLTFRPGGPLASTVAPNVARRSAQRADWRLDWFAPGLTANVAAAGPDVALCMGRMANCYGLAIQNAAPAHTVVATMRTGKTLPWLFRRSLGRVRHVVANSREACDTLIHTYRVSAEKISVIYNSLVFPPEAMTTTTASSADAAGSARSSLRRQHGASDATTVLLCVAMFRPEKNQRELIEIAAGLPRDADWQLWLAGEGPARAACEQLVAEKKLGERVKFLGFRRDPSSLYGAADIAVHASWSEALSNFLIEAQAHGLPAVAYAAQGIRECFIPERTGWAIARDDRAAFRSALLRCVASSAAERAALASAARRYARETFDPTRQVSAYLQLFEQLKQVSQTPHPAAI